jgi:hypothetical protein
MDSPLHKHNSCHEVGQIKSPLNRLGCEKAGAVTIMVPNVMRTSSLTDAYCKAKSGADHFQRLAQVMLQGLDDEVAQMQPAYRLCSSG